MKWCVDVKETVEYIRTVYVDAHDELEAMDKAMKEAEWKQYVEPIEECPSVTKLEVMYAGTA